MEHWALIGRSPIFGVISNSNWVVDLIPDLKLNESIWQVVAAIPSGQVSTYGQIARIAGYPNHSRQVGNTLKHLPKETRLPWHRVINAQGKISFPEDSEPYRMQRRRLEEEGVVFNSGKVALKEYGWDS